MPSVALHCDSDVPRISRREAVPVAFGLDAGRREMAREVVDRVSIGHDQSPFEEPRIVVAGRGRAGGPGVEADVMVIAAR